MGSSNLQTADVTATYKRYADMLYRLAYSILLSKEDAEDTVAEVFYKYMRKAPQFRDMEHEKAWFIRVTVNHSRDIQRKRVVRSYTPLDEVLDLSSQEPETVSLFEEVLALPDKYRTVCMLHYFEGFKVEEIASVLRITKAAVKMRLMRCREMLKTMLEGEDTL